MCFSLIEMHFNVVQISFLQLQSKLVQPVLCVHVQIYTCVCEKEFPQLRALPFPVRFTAVHLQMPPLSHKLTFLVQRL